MLVREDHEASRLPQSDLDLGLPLCRTHRDIYQAIRPNQVCTVLQCMRLRVSGPKGRHYCNDHMAAAVFPAPTGPKVKFENDPPHPKAPAMGMGDIPGDVLVALVHSMSYKEGLTDPEIADRLTGEYGGLLLHNALRIKDVRGKQTNCDPPSSSTTGHKVKEELTPASPLGGPVFPVVAPTTVPLRSTVPPVLHLPDDLHPASWAHSATPPSTSHIFPAPQLIQPRPVFPSVVPNVFDNVPASGQRRYPAPNFVSTDALPPIPDHADSNRLLAPIGYNIDRLANPETQAKPGTLDGIKRNEEIWVFVARYFNNFHVSMHPGVAGKQLAIGLKSLNDRLRPLYDHVGIPNGFSNRLCLGAASLTWGGRVGDTDYVLSGQDFIGWAPHQFDSYVAPSDWALETKARPAAHVETWKINAQNMSKQFPYLYGAEHLNERLQAVEDLRALHIREPHKYTLSFIEGAWGTLNYRCIQELKEPTNILRLHAGVERPTYDQLKAIGMTINPASGKTVFQMPSTFQVRGPLGYFQTEIVRETNAEKELEDWHHYHSAPLRNNNIRTGAVPEQQSLPGPPLTPMERRLASSSAPVGKSNTRM